MRVWQLALRDIRELWPLLGWLTVGPTGKTVVGAQPFLKELVWKQERNFRLEQWTWDFMVRRDGKDPSQLFSKELLTQQDSPDDIRDWRFPEEPTFEYITRTEDGGSATVYLGDLSVKTKNKKTRTDKDQVIRVELDADGYPCRPLRAVPRELRDMVKFITKKQEKYNRRLKKSNLYDKFPGHFNKQGDITFSSILRYYTPHELGILPEL